MFSFSYLVVSSLFALSAAQYSKCLMCIQDVPVLLSDTPIQSYHLGSKIEWTCGEIDAAGRAGDFTPEECIIAQQIAHACLCEHPTPTPTPAPIEIEPTCKICDGLDLIGNPSKVVTTMLGQNTCEDLIAASRNGYFPSNLCPEFETYNIPEKCGCTSKTVAPAVAPTRNGNAKSLPIPYACFSNHNTVHVQNKGLVRMGDLKIGDMVSIVDASTAGSTKKDNSINNDNQKFSRIYSFGHYNVNAVTEYLQIHTDDLPRPLEITSQHMVFVDQRGAIPAGTVVVGDKLLTTKTKMAKCNAYGNDLSSRMTTATTTTTTITTTSTVTKISKVHRVGAFAPFTESGTLTVNGVLVSSYISIIPVQQQQQQEQSNHDSHAFSFFSIVPMQWVAHASQAPHRMVCQFLSRVGKNNSFCDSETYTPEGISHWVNGPFVVAKYFINQNRMIQTVMGIPLVLALMSFSFLELMILDENNSIRSASSFPLMMVVLSTVGTLVVLKKSNNNNNKKSKLA